MKVIFQFNLTFQHDYYHNFDSSKFPRIIIKVTAAAALRKYLSVLLPALEFMTSLDGYTISGSAHCDAFAHLRHLQFHCVLGN